MEHRAFIGERRNSYFFPRKALNDVTTWKTLAYRGNGFEMNPA
jgi:hypothetical protein